MAGTFPWPRTEEEALEHLRERHGVWVRSMQGWRRLFGTAQRPKPVHVHDHKVSTQVKRAHRHTDYASFP